MGVAEAGGGEEGGKPTNVIHTHKEEGEKRE